MDHRIVQGREYWEWHAQRDPMWAVISEPARKGRKWTVRDFMANGEKEIALLWHQLAQLQLIPDRSVALDFGCGLGRLTQALARRFDRVIGVDISPSMIRGARLLNRYPAIADYVCNDHPDLRTIPTNTCDFIYSNIVLQHVEPHLSAEFLKEFLRVLKPGGTLVFQLPSHRDSQEEVAIRPMDDEAYDARIEWTVPPPAQLAIADVLTTVRVTNTSPREWAQAQHGSIRLGNHWFDATGCYMVVQDDGRTALPQILKPGESCDLALSMVAPSEPGRYQGEVDVVHEGVTWFRDKGSPALRFDVEVRPRSLTTAERTLLPIVELPVPDYPAATAHALTNETVPETEADPFPMHGVPQAQVLGIIAEHGGTLCFVEDGRRAGVEWVDYRYFVRG